MITIEHPSLEYLWDYYNLYLNINGIMESIIEELFKNLNITKNECKIVSNNFYKRLEGGVEAVCHY